MKHRVSVIALLSALSVAGLWSRVGQGALNNGLAGALSAALSNAAPLSAAASAAASGVLNINSATAPEEGLGAPSAPPQVTPPNPLENLERALQAAQIEQENVHRSILVKGRVYVRLVGLGLLPAAGGIDALATHASHVQLLKTALERDLARERALGEQVNQQRQQLALVQQQLVAQGAAPLAGIGDTARGHEAILAARERELAFQRAFGTTSEGDPHSTVYGSIASTVLAAATFADLKGRLPIPVEGRAEVREIDVSDERGPGVELRVALPGSAHAVYSGKVVFIGEYGGLGQAVLVEHDSGYSTLYGSLGQVAVEVGQQVNAGAKLGELSKLKAGARLYLEVRRGSERLYPSDWLGIH